MFWNASFFVLLEVACAALPKQEGDVDAAVLIARFEMKTICLVEKVYGNRHARTRTPHNHIHHQQADMHARIALRDQNLSCHSNLNIVAVPRSPMQYRRLAVLCDAWRDAHSS